MMIAQPPWVTPDLVDAAVRTVEHRGLAALDRVSFAPYAEGTCAQVLHTGPYDSEAPVLARLHGEFLPAHGLTFNGRHHEVYLSDARRTPPARLRTVLRQPVAPVPRVAEA